ncbi:MAG: hypothetical protein ACD_54C00251G0001 [uncultured bacterium]|nr:MAG: hypothetical protein ACD_54C00251G0001 [uncultured bacterium]
MRHIFRSLPLQPHLRHGGANGLRALFRCQFPQAGILRQFHIDRQTIRIKSRRADQFGRCIGDGLQVDIPPKPVLLPQRLRDPHHIGHRLIGRPNDPRRQKQPLDVIAPVKLQRQRHHFLNRKPRAFDIGRHPIDAIGAVKDAEIRHQDLQQRNAAPVRRIGMADAAAPCRANATLAGIALFSPRRSTGGIIFRRIR